MIYSSNKRPVRPELITELNLSFQSLHLLPRWITLCHNLKKLNCRGNGLRILPMLPDSLEELDCSNNRLQFLPYQLPNSLLRLNCHHNKLEILPERLPKNLHIINCANNQLKQITEMPIGLQILNCANNRLKQITELPIGLQNLNCSYNQLITLDGLPNNLRELNCSKNELVLLPDPLPIGLHWLSVSDNYLVELPNVPPMINYLDCSYNELTVLPEEYPDTLERLLINNNQLRAIPPRVAEINLRQFTIVGNVIDYIPPVLNRLLHRQEPNKNRGFSIYRDAQSVHNHEIQESVRRSIKKLREKPMEFTDEELYSSINRDKVLEEVVKKMLLNGCRTVDRFIISENDTMSYRQILKLVWRQIYRHRCRDEIKRVLNSEILDSRGKCFTGQIGRMVNSLSGFDKEVEVTISDSEQIGNIISQVRTRLEQELRYSVELHKQLVTEELEERGFDQGTVELWINYIE